MTKKKSYSVIKMWYLLAEGIVCITMTRLPGSKKDEKVCVSQGNNETLGQTDLLPNMFHNWPGCECCLV